jgi:hypothetical protein
LPTILVAESSGGATSKTDPLQNAPLLHSITPILSDRIMIACGNARKTNLARAGNSNAGGFYRF